MKRGDQKATAQHTMFTVTGGKPLTGEVTVRGAKNSATKLAVAALLTDDVCTLHNVPEIGDVEVVFQMIRLMGGVVEKLSPGTVRIMTNGLKPISHENLRSVSKLSRIPILFAGPLLHRFHEAWVPELGGCKIGERPVNFHIEALRALGVDVEEVHKGFHCTTNGLRGAKIEFSYPSVGATEQALLASVLAEGNTEIMGAAFEPEVMDLISVLQKMGAGISVEADRRIRIKGVSKLNGCEHTVIPDRIEVASWACAAAVTNGNIFVKNARQQDMMAFLNVFRDAGGIFEVTDEGIRFSRGARLLPVVIETNPHPGFVTDWQQPFVVLLTQAEGASIVHETVYEDRFGYTAALNQMGANIELHKECLGGNHCRFGERGHYHSAIITGPTPLRGAEITVPDLRAGFSYVIAALAAKGTSTLQNIEVISRGYEALPEKLKKLNAEISF